MSALFEVFPILAGVLTGVVCASIARRAFRITVWASSTVLFGALATYLSGEYAESWAFILLDMLLVGGTALAIVLGRQAYLRRRSRG